jgi:hypothetical protein
MADKPTSTGPSTPPRGVPGLDAETAARALIYKERLQESADLAKSLVASFRDISEKTKDQSIRMKLMASFSSEILKNDKARKIIFNQLETQTEDIERKIISLTSKRIELEKKHAMVIKLSDEERRKRLEQSGSRAWMFDQLRLESVERMNRLQVDASERSKKSDESVAKAKLRMDVAQSLRDRLQLKQGQLTLSQRLKLVHSIERLERDAGRLSEQALVNKQAASNIEVGITAEKQKQEQLDKSISREQEVRKLLENTEINAIAKLIGEEQKKLEKIKAATREVKLQSGYMAHLKDTAGGFLNILGPVGSGIAKFAKDMETIPPQFLIMDAVITSTLKRFKELDSGAEKFRRETGLTIAQMGGIRKYAEEISAQFADMGINIEKAYNAAKALVNTFGSAAVVTEDAMKSVALLSENLNVAVEDSAAALALFQGLGNTSQKVAINMIAVGSELAKKAYVPFQMAMKDIAQMSSDTVSLLGATPQVLLKAAIAARAYGLDINKAASAQKKLLDYNTSINDELLVSNLLGRSVSMQQARSLAYQGKFTAALEETLDVVESIGEVRDPYTRDAIAKMTGLELGDLTKALAKRKLEKEIMEGSDEAAKERLKTQKEVLKQMEETTTLSKEGVLAENEKILRQRQMQGLMTNLTNTMEDLAVAVGSILEPILTPLVSIVVPIFKLIGSILKLTIIPLLKMTVEPIKMLADLLSTYVIEPINNWAKSLDDVISKLNEAKDGVSAIGKVFLSLGSGLLLYFLFGKSKGIVGIIRMLGTVFNFTKTKMLEIFGLNKLMERFSRKPSTPISGGAGGAVGRTAETVSSGMSKLVKNAAAGAAAVGLIAGALYLFAKALQEFKNIDAKQIEDAFSALVLFGSSIAIFGLGLEFFVLGAASMVLITLSMKSLGGALEQLGEGAKKFVDGTVGIKSAVDEFASAKGLLLEGFSVLSVGKIRDIAVALETFGKNANDIKDAAIGIILISNSLSFLSSSSDSFGKKLRGILTNINKLGNIEIKNITENIKSLGSALSMSSGSIFSDWFGKSAISQLERFANIGSGLATSVSALQSLNGIKFNLENIDGFSTAVDKLAGALGKLNVELNKMNLTNLQNLVGTSGQGKSAAETKTEVTTNTNTTSMEQKLDTLIDLFKSGGIAVYLDGKKVHKIMADITDESSP